MDETEGKISIRCEKCGATFTAFLRQMAEHNQKVVCPKCGHAHGPQPVTNAPGTAPSKP